MDPDLIYAITPLGDEAVRQSTGVVQRNQRMVLVQLDGKLSVSELAAKMGNPPWVESALQDLERGGFIAALGNARFDQSGGRAGGNSALALSQFSTFGAKPADSSMSSRPSRFGRQVLAVSSVVSGTGPVPDSKADLELEPEPASPGWTRRALALVPVVALGLLALLVFFPYDKFKPAIEAAASRFLQTPVRVGQVGLTFNPWPQLLLSDLSLGRAGDSRVRSVAIDSPWLLLGSGPRVLPGLQVSMADMTANLLLELPMFAAQMPPTATDIALRRMRFEKSQVRSGDLSLRDISGEAVLRPDGSIDKASFVAFDHAVRLEAVPTARGIALNIQALGWKPADGPITVDTLQAKGLLRKDRLLVENIDATALGGLLKGNVLLDWGDGLAMAGEFSLGRLDCRKVSAAILPELKLQGELGGVLRLRAKGSDWQGMWQKIEATLDADVVRGVLVGIDLGEAARRPGTVVRSGATRFDRMRSAISIGPGEVSARDIRLEAGMMTAAGQFIAMSGRQVDGRLTVGIHTSVATRRMPVSISGTLAEPITVGGQ